MDAHVFATPAGFCSIAWSAAGISGFCLPSRRPGTAEAAIRRRTGAAPADFAADFSADPPADVRAVVEAVRRYFAGEPQDFTAVRLDLRPREPFFGQVYAVVRALRWGETATYGELAARLGAGPEAARDVGRAMGANPIPLLMPCHRVLAAGNRIGGFSAPGGSETKRRMLALEGVLLDDAPRQAAFAF